jgi:membrane protease YdiL (CAAX protease family)
LIAIAAGPTAIGAGFDTRARAWVAALIGVVAVTIDLLLCHAGTTDLLPRTPPALAALGLLFWLSRGRPRSLGIQVHPAQGWRYWVVPSAIAGGGVLLVSLIYLLLFPEEQGRLAEYGQGIADYGVWARVVFSCVEAPLLEEAVYRVILCASLVTVIGRVPTVLLSGVVFASLHFVYGNPGPDNAVAGFVLGWAYLKSESVTIPIIMHGCGNVVVIGVQLAAAALAG